MRLFVPKNNERMITKKEKKKKKGHLMQAQTIATTAPAIEISTQQEIIVTFAHLPPCSHDGYCLRVDVKPSTLKLWGLSAPASWGRSCSSLTPTHQVRFSPLPRTCFAPRLAFARSASFWLHSPSVSRCWTLRRSRSELAGLAPLMGKASVSNITVSSRSRRHPKSPYYHPFVACG